MQDNDPPLLQSAKRLMNADLESKVELKQSLLLPPADMNSFVGTDWSKGFC